MTAIPNPIDDKVRGARKRYGPRAALWALLTTLYAAGRDAEAQQLQQRLRRRQPEEVLLDALLLPELGRSSLGGSLIPWVAHRYHLAERSGEASQHFSRSTCLRNLKLRDYEP